MSAKNVAVMLIKWQNADCKLVEYSIFVVSFKAHYLPDSQFEKLVRH